MCPSVSAGTCGGNPPAAVHHFQNGALENWQDREADHLRQAGQGSCCSCSLWKQVGEDGIPHDPVTATQFLYFKVRWTTGKEQHSLKICLNIQCFKKQ